MVWGALAVATLGFVAACLPGPGAMFTALGASILGVGWPCSPPQNARELLGGRAARWLAGSALALASIRIAASYWAVHKLAAFAW